MKESIGRQRSIHVKTREVNERNDNHRCTGIDMYGSDIITYS